MPRRQRRPRASAVMRRRKALRPLRVHAFTCAFPRRATAPRAPCRTGVRAERHARSPRGPDPATRRRGAARSSTSARPSGSTTASSSSRHEFLRALAAPHAPSIGASLATPHAIRCRLMPAWRSRPAATFAHMRILAALLCGSILAMFIATTSAARPATAEAAGINDAPGGPAEGPGAYGCPHLCLPPACDGPDGLHCPMPDRCVGGQACEVTTTIIRNEPVTGKEVFRTKKECKIVDACATDGPDGSVVIP